MALWFCFRVSASFAYFAACSFSNFVCHSAFAMRASITFQRKFILPTSDLCSSLNNTVSPWDCTDVHNLGWNDNFLELKHVESNIETDLAWIFIFTSRCPSANGLLKSKWFEIHKKATMKQPWNYRNSHPNVDLICLNCLPPKKNAIPHMVDIPIGKNMIKQHVPHW